MCGFVISKNDTNKNDISCLVEEHKEGWVEKMITAERASLSETGKDSREELMNLQTHDFYLLMALMGFTHKQTHQQTHGL